MISEFFELYPLTYYFPNKRSIVQLSCQINDEIVKNIKSLFPEVNPIPVKRQLTSNLVIHSSYNCNLNCIYCSTEAGEKKDNSKIQMDHYVSAIDFIVRNAKLCKLYYGHASKPAIVLLSGGGEPTVEWDKLTGIVQEISKIRENEGKDLTRLWIITNAQCDLEKMNYIIEHFDRVFISCDGKSTQLLQRPRKDNESSWEYVECFLTKLNNSDKKFGVRMTVSGFGIRTLKDDVDYLFIHFPKLSFIHIEPFGFVGRAKTSEIISLDTDTFVTCFDEISRKYPGKIFSSMTILDERFGFPCHRLAGTSIVLSPSGNILACDSATPYADGWSNMVIGKAEQGKVFLEKEPLLPVLNEECRNCSVHSFCYGGCPLRIKRDNQGNIVDQDGVDFCNLIKGMIHGELLRLIQLNGKEPDLFNESWKNIDRYYQLS